MIPKAITTLKFAHIKYLVCRGILLAFVMTFLTTAILPGYLSLLQLDVTEFCEAEENENSEEESEKAKEADYFILEHTLIGFEQAKEDRFLDHHILPILGQYLDIPTPPPERA